MKESKSRAATPPRVPPVFEGAASWRHVIDRMGGECPLRPALYSALKDAERGEIGLIAPVCAAWAISRRPELMENDEPLRIAVVGAAELDSCVDGRLYQLIPWALGQPHRTLHVELVGPEIVRAKRSPKTSLARGLAPAELFPTDIERWLAMRGEPPPDLVLLFHPGLEAHLSGWLDDPADLTALVKFGAPISAFAFDLDEAERDCAILECFGISTTPAVSCPFGICDQGDSQRLRRAEFACAMYQIEGIVDRPCDSERVASIIDLTRAMLDVFSISGNMFRHADAWRTTLISRGGTWTQVLHVFDHIYFDPASREIFLAANGEQLTDFPAFEFHINSVSEALAHLRPLDRALTAFGIYRSLVPATSRSPAQEEAMFENFLGEIDEFVQTLEPGEGERVLLATVPRAPSRKKRPRR